VARVLDGDTLLLADGKKVRLLGVDTPELEKAGRPAEFLAHRAKQELTNLAQGKRVRLEYDRMRYDQYGRLLAYLYLPDGRLVNAELVRQGLARVYLTPPNVRQREALLTVQREALAAQRGIWLKALRQDEEYYVANRNSHRFHRPSCPLVEKMAPANRLRVSSLVEAYLAGFSPCRTCRPHEAWRQK